MERVRVLTARLVEAIRARIVEAEDHQTLANHDICRPLREERRALVEELRALAGLVPLAVCQARGGGPFPGVRLARWNSAISDGALWAGRRRNNRDNGRPDGDDLP
jgi:hypothetical protein